LGCTHDDAAVEAGGEARGELERVGAAAHDDDRGVGGLCCLGSRGDDGVPGEVGEVWRVGDEHARGTALGGLGGGGVDAATDDGRGDIEALDVGDLLRSGERFAVSGAQAFRRLGDYDEDAAHSTPA